MRLPSGDTATPWPASIPLISPTTLFVAGSMMWMLSPAEFVWMIRSLDCCAAAEEIDTVHRAIPARAVRPTRSNCLFVIFVIPLFSYSAERSSEDRSVHQETVDRYFTVAPSMNAFRVCHSGSCCEANCWAPP